MLKIEQIKAIIGDEENFQIPPKLMKIVLDKKQREKMFRKFLDIETDLSYDWFHEYFMELQADRKGKKQDFTPTAISNTTALLLNGDSHHEKLVTPELKSTNIDAQVTDVLEPAAGTGSMLIADWYHHYSTLKFKFHPALLWYQAEELSDAALPFLILNLAIRGINGVIIHGDSLNRKVKNIYYLRNQGKADDEHGVLNSGILTALGIETEPRLAYDDPFKFSDVFKMPKTDELKQMYQVEEWDSNY